MGKRVIGKSITLGLPDGRVRHWYQDFRDNWNFTGHLWISAYAGAKSTALSDCIGKSALEYPGSRLLLVGNTLTDLRKSTIPKLEGRIGMAIESENRNEAIYRFPSMPDPLTGELVQSELRCLGADRPDIEEVLKSTEWFRVFIEEANTIRSDAHDVLLARTRQFAFHRTFTVQNLIIDKSRLWGIDPDEAYDVLSYAEGSPIKQFALSMDDPMPGINGVKAVMNPQGNDHVWMRYVGLPFPENGVTRKWAADNIGLRNFYFTKAEMDEIMVPFLVGNHVVDKDGNYGYVREVAGNDVALMDGKKYKGEDLELVMQLYTTYTFPDDNKSRNYANHQNALLMMNRGLRKRTFAGVVDVRAGLVFPNFIPRPVDEGGHILPFPKDGIPRGYQGVGGVDQGGGHATAAVVAMLTKETNTAIIFKEYVKSGVSAKQTAYELASSLPPGMSVRWGGDPKMWSRDYTEDITATHAQKYVEAGLSPFEPGKKGDEAFDDVMDLLEFVDNFLNRKKQAKLYVFDNCEQSIHALSTVTWDDIRHGRHKWIVDLADAVKLMVSMINKAVFEDDVPMPVGRRVYGDRFAR